MNSTTFIAILIILIILSFSIGSVLDIISWVVIAWIVLALIGFVVHWLQNNS